ncbi:PqqD family protein [Geovibrio thiophilus]|uniref:PqqD family protein n=1 Tax=Geovibrio thiophilus TaxID=139438 RepID=A0A3R5UX32_9BACT|nr:PqqD family protein [Geovibrio thiophilus]QAR32567.1 PqqD family protein [Geovibrio thiophilus]
MTRLTVTKKAVSYEVGDIVVKLDSLGDDKVLIFNNVAAFIWKIMESSPAITLVDLVEKIELKYDVSQKDVIRDVRIFLESLVYLEMIDAVPISFDGLKTAAARSERESYRPPKIYIYDLKTDEEVPFGPHIKGRTYTHRAITKSWHGGCC